MGQRKNRNLRRLFRAQVILALAIMLVVARMVVADFRVDLLGIIGYLGWVAFFIPFIAYYLNRRSWLKGAAALAVFQGSILLILVKVMVVSRSHSMVGLYRYGFNWAPISPEAALGTMTGWTWTAPVAEWTLSTGIIDYRSPLLLQDFNTGQFFVVGSYENSSHGQTYGSVALSEQGRDAVWIKFRPSWRQLLRSVVVPDGGFGRWPTELYHYNSEEGNSWSLGTGIRLPTSEVTLDLSASGQTLLVRSQYNYWVYDLPGRTLVGTGVIPSPIRRSWFHRVEVDIVENSQKIVFTRVPLSQPSEIRWYTLNWKESIFSETAVFNECGDKSIQCYFLQVEDSKEMVFLAKQERPCLEREDCIALDSLPSPGIEETEDCRRSCELYSVDARAEVKRWEVSSAGCDFGYSLTLERLSSPWQKSS